MAKKIYFITGGARSGKSTFAVTLADGLEGTRAYIATAQALDDEMSARIEQHKAERGSTWDTFEEPLAGETIFPKLNGRYQVVLFDCLTLWLSNVMAKEGEDRAISARIEKLIEAVKKYDGSCIIVSNEVGLGIVPENPLARKFRDVAGILNQRMAQAADEVYFMASGIPVKIK